MTRSKQFLFSVDQFVLEFDLDIEASVQQTQRFSARDGPACLYAVVEVWMRSEGDRYLIFPKIHPGNFFEDLSHLARAMSNPPSVPRLETIIPRGGWCSWMAPYWDRLDKELLTPDDEAIYENLIHLSMLESRLGHLAIYAYQNSPIIEVATRLPDASKVMSAWASFESKSAKEQIDGVSRNMAHAIRAALDGV